MCIFCVFSALPFHQLGSDLTKLLLDKALGYSHTRLSWSFEHANRRRCIVKEGVFLYAYPTNGQQQPSPPVMKASCINSSTIFTFGISWPPIPVVIRTCIYSPKPPAGKTHYHVLLSVSPLTLYHKQQTTHYLPLTSTEESPNTYLLFLRSPLSSLNTKRRH